MRNKKLKKYSKSGYETVEGWLIPIAMRAIIEIALIQQTNQLKVWFVKLESITDNYLSCSPSYSEERDKRSLGLFENQGVGKGDRDLLLFNLNQHKCDLDRIKIKTRNSIHSTPEDILGDCEGHPRHFSVDGGHSAEITYHDLSLPADTICNGGVIILDGLLMKPGPEWPRVPAGIC